MTSTIDESLVASPEDTLANRSDLGPDWDRIPFDVHCSRCGEDLQGRSDPTCPACKLTFEWSDVAPIEQLKCLHCDYHLYGLSETRCPECGENFSWDAVLADYYRRQKPLFEYRWREHPIKSFFGTWLRAMRPKKFWTTLDIHDPPQAGAIGVMLCSMILSFFLCFFCMATLHIWMINDVQFWLAGRIGTSALFSSLPKLFIESISGSETFSVMLTLIIWTVMSLASLLVFQQSMKRYKVLTVQVFRVWAYTIPIYPILVCIITFMVGYCMILSDFLYYRGARGTDIVSGMVMFIGVIRALHLAYRDYLKMDHSLGVAIASQAIAILCTLTILDFVDDQGYGMQIAIMLLDLIH